jgi:hypothetical protein
VCVGFTIGNTYFQFQISLYWKFCAAYPVVQMRLYSKNLLCNCYITNAQNKLYDTVYVTHRALYKSTQSFVRKFKFKFPKLTAVVLHLFYANKQFWGLRKKLNIDALARNGVLNDRFFRFFFRIFMVVFVCRKEKISGLSFAMALSPL